MENYVAQILFISIGVFLLLVAGFLWKTKKVSIIEFYDERKVYNEKALLKWMILCFSVAGSMIIISSILSIYFSFISEVLFFSIIVCVMALMIGIGCNKYEV